MRSTAIAVHVDVRYAGIRYRGDRVAVPVRGDYLLKPMRKALIVLSG